MNSNNLFLLFGILLLPLIGFSQDFLLAERLDSFSKTLNFHSSFENSFSQFRFDSSTSKKIIQKLAPDNKYKEDLAFLKKPASLFSVHRSKPFLKTGGGYISYSYDHRSGMDSSVIWNNISQHLVSASINAVIAQSLPIRITYLERRSNSPYFKDFRDVRVDVDVQQYRRLRLQKALNRLNDYAENLRDPLLPYKMKLAETKSVQFKSIVNDPSLVKELIHAKESLIRKEFSDTTAGYRDSVVTRAKKFIQFYDSLQVALKRYERLNDSLQKIYQQSEQRIRRTKQLLNGNTLSPADLARLTAEYGKQDERVHEIRRAYSGIRSFSLGRTLPNFSGLTLQNVNVNGINLEYTRNNFYTALAAGIVDFRIRDFLYSQQTPAKQFVYAARLGYGTREGNHLMITYFRGRKQLFGGNLQRTALSVQGISLSGQFFIYKGIKVYGEVAQSGIPYTPVGNVSDKSAIKLTDPSQRAYEAGFSAWLPKTQTIANGHYRHTGLNYQSFNSFQYNAAASSWAFGLTQPFWKRQLTLQASFRKNDFVNPLIQQRYNSNTVFKNLTLTFRKDKWPVLSIGYLPASQYTAVGSQVFENHYQTFTGTASYQYKIGTANASSLMLVSQFFNDNSDSAFVYYNSKNFYWNQTLGFRLFTSTLSLSVMNNGYNDLIVMEEGLSTTLFKMLTAGFAVKINNLNRTTTKVGFNANTSVMLKQLGTLNVWMEQSYLPSVQNKLFKYEMYNIGMTKYF